MKRKIAAAVIAVFMSGQCLSGIAMPCEAQEKQTESLSYYNSEEKGYCTSVKNQALDNTCWAFAAVSTAETNAIKQGLVSSNVDLSEYHLAYYFNHLQADRLGNTAGDQNINKVQDFRDASGNNMYTTMTLMNGIGFAAEEKYPYGDDSKLTDDGAYDTILRLKSAHWLLSEKGTSDAEEMKNMILKYGAISAVIYTEEKYQKKDALCYIGNARENHAVSIVGWDDAYSRTNFNENCRPTKDGAWIVKNSWGISKGNKGYFHVSYEDSTIGEACIAYEMMKADKEQIDYQYDGTSSLEEYETLKKNAGVLSMFDASEEGQVLDSISIALAGENTDCEIQVYTECMDTLPSSLDAVYEEPQKATVRYPGYVTIDLEEPVYIEPGSRFGVSVSFPNGAAVYMDKSSSTSWMKFESHCEAGQTFYRYNANSWIDAGSTAGRKRVVRLKAHAHKGTVPTASPSAEPTAEPTQTAQPTIQPTAEPTLQPTIQPTAKPTQQPTTEPTLQPTIQPTAKPTQQPTAEPTLQPTIQPTAKPTQQPTAEPTIGPIIMPTQTPPLVVLPTVKPTKNPTPTAEPTLQPTIQPTAKPTLQPTTEPTIQPTAEPTIQPTEAPTAEPTVTPTAEPTAVPTAEPTATPTQENMWNQQAMLRQNTGTGNNGNQTPAKKTKDGYIVSRTDGIKQVSQTQKSIKIQWKEQKYADAYEIELRTGEKGTFKKVKTVFGNLTQVTLTGLAPDTEYTCRVRAYSKGNSGNVYGPYSKNLKIATSTKAPVLKKAERKSKTSVKIVWSQVKNASGYEVYAKEENGKYKKIATVKDKQSLLYQKAKSEKSYTIKVRSYRLVAGKKVYSTFSKVKKTL